MNVKDYEYIVEISRRRSLSEAADRLCITQSALTKFVQRVEAEMGTPLFKRIGKRFVLTPIGQMYVAKGQEILRLDREMQDELQKMRADGEGAIRLGYSMGQSSFIISCLLPEFYRRESATAVSLKEDSSSGLIRSVENGELDLCLAYCREEKPGLACIPLTEARLSLAVPRRSRLLRLAAVREDSPHPVLEHREWLEEPYIRLAAFTQSGRLAQEYFQSMGIWPKNRLYVENVRSALGAVENGLGNCILAEVPHPGFQVEYLSLPGLKGEKQTASLIMRKGEYETEAFRLLVRLARELYLDPESPLEIRAGEEPAEEKGKNIQKSDKIK